MDKEDLARLFISCDQDSNGYLCEDEFRRLCSELSLNENEFIALFDAVDVNRDGKIQLHEFIDKFHVVAKLYLNTVVETGDVTNSIESECDNAEVMTSRLNDTSSWEAFVEQSGHVIDVIPSSNKVLVIWRSIWEKGNLKLLEQFDEMLLHLVRDYDDLKGTITQIQASLIRVREQSEERISIVEEEMETQLKIKEDKTCVEERERYNKRSKEESKKHAKEIFQLQEIIENFKQVDEKLSGSLLFEEERKKIKEKLGGVTSHNASLRTKLNEADTKIALLSSQISALKLELQERNLEFERENEAISLVLSEKENMSRQVDALFSDNRRLIDSNDDLREVLDTSYATIQRISSRLSRSPAPHPHSQPSYDGSSALKDPSAPNVFCDVKAFALCDPGLNNNISHDNYDDTSYNNSKMEANYAYNGDTDALTIKNDADSESELDRLPEFESRFPAALNCSTPVLPKSALIDDTLDKDHVYLSDENEGNEYDSTSRVNRRLTLGDVRESDWKPLIDGRVYKVILCGDTNIGKTSFVLRLSKNQFLPHSRSTLGVDFYQKTINLDKDRAITLQLWDTAGQERFKSITTSYFRKADGVILLYDVTSPSSFLNVRNWMETISSCSPDGAPIIICGNKTDLRPEMDDGSKTFVYPKDGAEMAASYGVLFMETSAYAGTNVQEAVTLLARHLSCDVIITTSQSEIKELKKNISKPNCC